MTDINFDLNGSLNHLADPPMYRVQDCAGGEIEEYEERQYRKKIVWDTMRSEQKKMVKAILHTVDIIAEHISAVNIKEVASRRKFTYGAGFQEPYFLATTEPDLKSRRPIIDQKKFVYSTETMEGMTPEQLRVFNKKMFQAYYDVLFNGGNEVDDQIRKMCEEGMQKHKDH